MNYTTKSEKETRALARTIAAKLEGGDVVLLEGELGSGKTTFVKGFAKALRIREHIKSPTFVLMHVHKVAKSLGHRAKGARTKALCSMPYALRYFIHVDAYRVKNAQELMDAGIMDWLGRPDTLVVVEWGEKIKSLVKEKRVLTIRFSYGRDVHERMIRIAKGL